MNTSSAQSDTTMSEAPKEVALHDTFTMFQKLPVELRRKILSYTENFEGPPRWFSVGPCWLSRSRTPITPLCIIVHDPRDLKHLSSIPTMSICRESRLEALRKNIPWRSMEPIDPKAPKLRSLKNDSQPSSATVLVNPMKDVFFFGASDWSLEDSELENAAARISDATQAIAAFGKVRHLAVSLRTLWEADVLELKIFLAYMSNFSQLEDLTIVVPDEPAGRVKPIASFHYIESLQTPFALRMTGVLQRYFLRLFRNLDEKPSEVKLPILKVIYHSEHIALLSIYEKFESRECWEAEWNKVLQENWESVVQQLEREELLPRDELLAALNCAEKDSKDEFRRYWD